MKNTSKIRKSFLCVQVKTVYILEFVLTLYTYYKLMDNISWNINSCPWIVGESRETSAIYILDLRTFGVHVISWNINIYIICIFSLSRNNCPLYSQNEIFFQTYTDQVHDLGSVRPHLYHSLENFLDECFNVTYP